MPSPDYYVLDGDSGAGVAPRRAGIDDLGGAAKEDDQAYPPDPVTMPTAADANQIARLLAGVGRVCPVAVISIDFAAGVPYVKRFTAMGTEIEAGDLTITDLDVGTTRIAWPAGAFPPASAEPMVSLNVSNGARRICAVLDEAAHKVEVTSVVSAGTTIDAAFTVALY